MGSSYADWVRGLPKPVGFANVPRSSETRRRDCCRDAENWSLLVPNHSFSRLLMSARLMETVPGMVSGRGAAIASLQVWGAAPIAAWRARGPRRVRGAAPAYRSCVSVRSGASRAVRGEPLASCSHNAGAPSR